VQVGDGVGDFVARGGERRGVLGEVDHVGGDLLQHVLEEGSADVRVDGAGVGGVDAREDLELEEVLLGIVVEAVVVGEEGLREIAGVDHGAVFLVHLDEGADGFLAEVGGGDGRGVQAGFGHERDDGPFGADHRGDFGGGIGVVFDADEA